jgi:hypothetical protein
MDDIKTFINLISTGKHGSAKIALSELLNDRAIKHIDSQKSNIAKNLFKR